MKGSAPRFVVLCSAVWGGASASKVAGAEGCPEPDPQVEDVASLLQSQGRFNRYGEQQVGGTGAGGSDLLQEAPNCTLFTLWDFTNKEPPPYFRLNHASWVRHSRGLCKGPVLINDTNVMQWIPDMPEEYFRLPYAAAKSDAIRYALLYHHGGFYLDSDFLVVKDLGETILRQDSHDLIAYAMDGQDCQQKGTFSSSFLGGRRGSPVLKAVWEEQKSAMINHCPLSRRGDEVACCFDDKSVPCHVPWAHIGEGISHRVLHQMVSQTNEMGGASVFCFGGVDSFVPDHFLSALQHAPQLEQAMALWAKRGVQAPLDRIGYHLFNSNTDLSRKSQHELFDITTTVGFLYSKSFAPATVEKPSAPQLAMAEPA